VVPSGNLVKLRATGESKKMQFLEKLKPLGLLVLRITLAASFVFHGYPKLTEPARALKAFPGYGFPSYFAYISGVLEVFGGGLLILGLFTRGIALLLAIEMGLVLGRVIIPSAGIYAFQQYELPLLLGAAAVALATTGAGVISIDTFTFESRRKSGKKSKSKD
jgi:putative oxidoreductase